MRLLLDECIDWRLIRDFPTQQASTVRQMGWNATENGALLALAEKEFDVFITVDKNLAAQENVGKFDLAIVVLRARTNRLADLRPLVPKLLELLPGLKPGDLRVISETGS